MMFTSRTKSSNQYMCFETSRYAIYVMWCALFSLCLLITAFCIDSGALQCNAPTARRRLPERGTGRQISDQKENDEKVGSNEPRLPPRPAFIWEDRTRFPEYRPGMTREESMIVGFIDNQLQGSQHCQEQSQTKPNRGTYHVPQGRSDSINTVRSNEDVATCNCNISSSSEVNPELASQGNITDTMTCTPPPRSEPTRQNNCQELILSQRLDMDINFAHACMSVGAGVLGTLALVIHGPVHAAGSTGDFLGLGVIMFLVFLAQVSIHTKNSAEFATATVLLWSAATLAGVAVKVYSDANLNGMTTELHPVTAVFGISACLLFALFIMLQVSSHLKIDERDNYHAGYFDDMLPTIVLTLGMAGCGGGLFYNLADNGNTFDAASVNGLETGISVCATLFFMYFVYCAYHRGSEGGLQGRNILSKTGSIVICTLIGVTGALTTASLWEIEDETWITFQKSMLPLCVGGLLCFLLCALYGRAVVNDNYVAPLKKYGHLGNVLLTTGVVSTIGGTVDVMVNLLNKAPEDISVWWFVLPAISLFIGILQRGFQGRGRPGMAEPFWLATLLIWIKKTVSCKPRNVPVVLELE